MQDLEKVKEDSTGRWTRQRILLELYQRLKSLLNFWEISEIKKEQQKNNHGCLE